MSDQFHPDLFCQVHDRLPYPCPWCRIEQLEALVEQARTTIETSTIVGIKQRIHNKSRWLAALAEATPCVGSRGDTMSDIIEPGAIVVYRGQEFQVGVDNGSHVHLPGIPDNWATRDWHPKAGKWGGPPLYNRWVSKHLLETTP